jgi:hypothetical protein
MRAKKFNIFHRKVRHEEKELTKLFWRYCDPLPGTPRDEYNCLIHHVISSLHSGQKESEIKDLIESEFTGHFGINVPPHDIEKVSREIMKWWNTEQGRSPDK